MSDLPGSLDRNGILMPPEGITDAEINHLRGMTKPTFLEITDSPIKGRGISVLRELQYLDPLCLINTDIGDDGIESIGLFNKDTVLNLSGSKITDTGNEAPGRSHRVGETRTGTPWAVRSLAGLAPQTQEVFFDPPDREGS